MPEIQFKDRAIRLLPGRIRTEVFGLKKNSLVKGLVEQSFSNEKGILKLHPCTDTGRVLIQYDEKRITISQILTKISTIEEQLVKKEFPLTSEETEQLSEQEAAVTREEIHPNESESIHSKSIPNHFKVIPKIKGPNQGNQIPIPLALSIGGFAILGIKQLLMGRSALGRSPAAFHAAGMVSILTGYPMLKRGFRKFSQENKINSDLILGSSAVVFALVRENLVVLAGLSLLQYLNWKRSLTQHEEHSYIQSPEIQTYTERASKIGLLLGGATFALTRSPLRAMAVLLAANPRPISMTAEYVWKQADFVARQQKLTVPKNGALCHLANIHGVIVDDTSLVQKDSIEVSCVTHETKEEKLWGIAASLLKKANHPWKDEVFKKVDNTEQTIRTAFSVEQTEDGIKGKINNTEVYFGSLGFMGRYGIDCSEFQLKSKRLERHGHTVQFVAKKLVKEIKCLGLIVKPGSEKNASIKQLLGYLGSYKPYILNNSVQMDHEILQKQGYDTSFLHLDKREYMGVISSLRGQGQEIVHVKNNKQDISEFGLPTITLEEVNQLYRSIEYAKKMDQIIGQHFRVTKMWNVLGTALAIPYYMAAPLINLAADGLTLFFLARAKRISEAYFSKPIGEPKGNSYSQGLSWHAMTTEEITNHFHVTEMSGLEPNQINEQRKKYGLNELSPKQPTPWISAFMGQFKEYTTLILVGAAGLAFVTGGVFDGIAMGAVLIANAAIGTIQERKAEKVVDALTQFQPAMSKVIRDYQEMEIVGTELVPGDIVCLEAGNRVPADLRILQAWNLEINEAALTGESLPVPKTAEVQEEECPLPESRNMLYMGTDVTRGKAIALVVRTGMGTEIGHLMSLMKEEEKQITPLQEKVTSISKKFVKGAMVAGGLVFISGLLRGVPVTQLISTSVTLAASAVPEGLPVTITIALSAGIFRMASKNALIRKLSALETLGRTTIICSDKTGTLTKNEMTVKAIATTRSMWHVTGDGYKPVGDIIEMGTEVAAASASPISNSSEIQDQELNRLLRISLLCNNSKLEKEGDRWGIKGDPTEGALLTLAAKAGLNKENAKQWTRCHEEPFDSYSGMMSVVCKETEADDRCYLLAKGSVEAILHRCHWYQQNGEVYELTEEKRKEILLQNEKFAVDALRVLGFAYCPVEWNAENTNIKENRLIYVGMAGMMDPPKEDVEKSIRESYQLGVMPVMITGDHPITAIAIAKQLGIWDGKRKVLTGTELNQLSDEELAERVEDVSIFARVSPEHKLKIVTAFQKRGHIVAMTGDGVNDSPAIKKANVGIAMGRTGTEVTKETADMVLKEDHFGSIVDGVKEGRTIIGNIRKAIGCLLTGNLAEVLVTSTAVIAGMPMPLIPIQILLMNLLTDALPAMILAINPGDKRKNTKRQDIVDKELYQKVITRGVLLGIGSVALFGMALAAGAPIAVAQTTAFATLVAGQLMQTFSWRQEGKEEKIRDWTKDRFLIGALGISWTALLATIYVPPIARIFHAAPLPINSWVLILAVAGSISFLSKPVLNMISNRQTKIKPKTNQMMSMAA
ncbi:MAG TPA: HAD-IC family P-type ATPase [Bacillota bacterium]|nr:HAD-IC family P-type ATPase [Bacillota bacterium]